MSPEGSCLWPVPLSQKPPAPAPFGGGLRPYLGAPRGLETSPCAVAAPLSPASQHVVGHLGGPCQPLSAPHSPLTDMAALQVSFYSDEDRGWGSPRNTQPSQGPRAVVPHLRHGPPSPGSWPRYRGQAHTRQPLSPPRHFFREERPSCPAQWGGGNTGPSQLLLAGTYGRDGG